MCHVKRYFQGQGKGIRAPGRLEIGNIRISFMLEMTSPPIWYTNQAQKHQCVRFVRMVADVDQRFLITRSWDQVRRRMQ